MDILICPICGSAFTKDTNRFYCKNSHSYDISKEGYVNFLSGNKKDGSFIGDNKEMARSRRFFLEKNYYLPFAEKISSLIDNGTVLDICCGEGYYTQIFAEKKDRNVFGFDISKEMIKLASKRKSNASFFVGNMSRIPVKSESIGTAVHIFAPFCEKEFARVLSQEGKLISAVAGKNHLIGLKNAIYDTPYLNDEVLPQTEELILTDKINLNYEITLRSNEEILSLFEMTPYCHRTSQKDKEKLNSLNNLTTLLDFNILIYKKNN